MKFVLFSIGTRGDIEPFLAVAELLKNEGHRVICSFPAQFKNLADEAEIEFFPLSKEFLELVDGDDAKMAMGGKISFLKKLGAYIRLYKLSENVNKDLVLQQEELVAIENPDKIIYGGKAIYPVLWGIKNPGRAVFLSPVPYLTLYTKEHPHIGFKGNHGPMFNKFTYAIANYGLIKHIVSTSNRAGIKIQAGGKAIKKELQTRNAMYMLSSAIFPRPDYWPPEAKVLGYRERNKKQNWNPGEELTAFLQNHTKVLLITFGSMTNPDPEEKSSIIIRILQKHNIPAIINTSSGGLIKPADYDSKLIHFVENIPYDWIFPRVYGVIHHGGSGTTQTALKYGCASMIIPHIIDQFLWNDFVSESGAGPSGPPINKLTEKNFEEGLLALYKDESYKKTATELGKKIRAENRDAELMELLTGS